MRWISGSISASRRFCDQIQELNAVLILGQISPCYRVCIVAIVCDSRCDTCNRRPLRGGTCLFIQCKPVEVGGNRTDTILIVRVVPGLRYHDGSLRRRMRIGDSPTGRHGSRLTGIAGRYCAFSDGILDRSAIGDLRQTAPGIGPVVAILFDGRRGCGIAGRNAVQSQRKRLGTDAVLVVRVVPDLRNRYIRCIRRITYSNFISGNRSITIGYRGFVFSCSFTIFIGESNCCSVAFRNYFKVDRIYCFIICRCCFFKFIKPTANLQSFTFISFRSKGDNLLPTTVPLLIQFESCTGESIFIFINFVDYDFIVWIPVVGILCAVNIIRLVNGAGYGVAAYRTRRRPIIISIIRVRNLSRCLSLHKLITIYHTSFLNGIGCASRKVEETDIPASLYTDSKLCSGRNRIAACRIVVGINLRCHISRVRLDQYGGTILVLCAKPYVVAVNVRNGDGVGKYIIRIRNLIHSLCICCN